MYSLIWDCGPMLNTLFYNLGRQQMKTLPVNVCKILSTWHNAAAKHKDWIAGIRSDVCHNNSEEYYFCRNSRQAHHNFLLNSSGKDFKLVTYTEADWAAVCRQWLYLCENFLTEYKHALAKLDMLPGPDKVAFAEIWLSYIAQWYERSADICSSVLADIYPVSLTNRGKSSRDIRKFELYRWVANGWRAISHTGDNNTDSYNAYIKFVDIGTYLKSPACPTPALPKDALSALFKKTAQKF